MQNVLDTGKRALSAAIAVATIAFTVGAAGLLKPLTTHAATAGTNFKSSSLTSVYYMGFDGMRYTYPNENTYKSWYMTSSGGADFSSVVTMSDTDVSNITLGGNIVVRPGTYWVKIVSDPKLYAVGRDGQIHWIESESVASSLRGSDWNSTATTIDVPDVFFTDYTVGTSLMSATAYDGMFYVQGGVYYLDWDGESREVTSAGISANRLMTMFAADGSSIDDSSLSSGSTISGADSAIMDTAQTVEDSSVSTGALTLSASSSMPAGSSLPKGANSVEVFSFNATAGSAAATLESLALTLTGAGSTSDITNVYLYEGNTRLTEARTVNSSTRQVSFSNLGLDVNANSTRTFTARVTVSSSATAADTFGFKIAASTDVTSGGSVSGSFPITGNTFSITGSSVGSLTVTKTGSISDPTLGEQDAEIAQFKMTASGSEGASIEQITLKIDNASDHSDFRLWDGSSFLVSGSNTSGDWVMFDLSADPFAIEEGGNNIFSVSADIGGQDGDTVKVFVDNTVDVVAIGSDFGFGLTVDTGTSGTYDGTSCTSSSGNCSFSTIQGGELTIAFNGPSSDDVQIDSQDQVLMNFSVTAAQEVTIKDLDIQVAADDDNDGDPTDGVESGTSDDDGLINTGSEANVKDIKIINADTGAVVMGPLELDTTTDNGSDTTSLTGSAEDALQIIDFTDDWTLDAGETVNLSVTVDVDNGLTSGETLVAILDISGLSVEDQNGDALSSSDIVPGSDITGYNQTARSASLTFSLASTPGDVTTVDGTDNVSVVAFAATAGDASDVTVTDFVLSVYGDDDGDNTMTLGGETNADVNDYIESCSLYEDSTLLAGPEAPASNGQTIDFDTIDWTVAAGDVTTLTVKCNFANTSTSGNAYFSFDINDVTTDVTAEDEDGDNLAASSLSGSDINGATTSINAVTVADSGTLTAAVGSDTPSADFLLASSSNTQVSTFRFTAANEAFNVDTLTFSEEQAEDDTGSADSSAYANNISLVTITYPKADGTTGTKTAAMSGNEAKFSSLDMYVAVTTPSDVKVYVNVPATDRDAGGSATSNEKVRMGLFVDTTNDDNFKAVGAGSGVTKDDDDQGALGDDKFATDGIATFVVRETKPTITLSSSSPSGSAVVGRSEVLRFNVAASSNEDVVLSKLAFKLSTTDNSPIATASWNACDTDQDAGEMRTSDFDLYNLTTDGTSTTLDTADSDWQLYKTTGAVCDSTEATVGFARITLPTVEIVPKGSTYTFALYLDATGASSSADDSIRVDMPTDPIVAQASFLSSSALNENNLTSTDNTLTVSSSAGYVLGDVLSMDTADDGSAAGDELMLLTKIVDGTTIEVVRGYLDTAPDTTSANDAADDIDRIPGALLWQDDGSSSVSTSYQEYYGAYLVDNLTVSGGTLVF